MEQLPASGQQSLAHEYWLGTDWQTDAAETQTAIATPSADWLIVDHYALDARWERQLRSHCCHLLVIDDLADRDHDCDLLLDQNLVADWQHRYQDKVPAHCGLMLGPTYALLQSQYAQWRPQVRPREGAIRRVLAYFGGADSDNLTGRAIAAFLSLGCQDVMLDVVINPASPFAVLIRQQVANLPTVTLHGSLPSLTPLMTQADIALGAGGATTWERCCLGLPSLVITLAANQRPVAAELDRRGLIQWLGHKDAVSETAIAQRLKALLAVNLSPAWSERCSAVVDGLGCDRVSSIVRINAQTSLRTRLAVTDDEAQLLTWANDSLVRQNAFSTASIDPAIHNVWFHQRLKDQDHCCLYIVETDEGFPLGQVRFQKEAAAWEIHYSLDIRFRGRGLARLMLKAAVEDFRVHVGRCLIFGQVKRSNIASSRVFQSLGFTSEQNANQSIYTLSL
jgi:UDP-2,4-diacetamido-2,4,6-trideoxy-beta-L-altropyranose hydrolase